MKVTTPALNAIFRITAAPAWPPVLFETDLDGPHLWEWTIAWDAFSASGSVDTASNTWDATSVVTNRGGTLTVNVSAGDASASATVHIVGTNPTEADVVTYLSATPASDGFDRIIKHETKFRHFGANDEPKKSFDKGYGMCQLTTPAPTFEQAWNWKLNVNGGLSLFAQKRAAARTFLGQSGRQFTDTQLRFETVCRWNGGQYHRWDAVGKRWIRSPHVLCDSATGNIGWDMTDPQNAGKTEAQLHARDSASYSTPPPGPTEHWRYFGICYADRVLG
jgi:hypothetical protein